MSRIFYRKEKGLGVDVVKQTIHAFQNYVSSYQKQAYEYDLKIAHTYRVMDYCEEIARSLYFSEEEIELARLCGLLHDIARFEQFHQYHTFIDSKSFDHDDYGEELLRKGLIREFNSHPEWDEILFKAVKYHNKYALPDNLTGQETLFCQIIRDADKLDILYLATQDKLMITKVGNTLSDSVLQCILTNQSINASIVQTRSDVNCLRIAFLYDFNFVKSLEIVKERNYLNTIIDMELKDADPIQKDKWLLIKEHINEYLNDRIINYK